MGAERGPYKKLPTRHRLRHFLPTEQDANRCWRWLGSFDSKGYGKFWYENKVARAHRVVYIVFVGPIPTGFLVRHTCNNRWCVNYNHLVLGTRNDNKQDRKMLYRRKRAMMSKPDSNTITRRRDGLQFAKLYSQPNNVFCGGCKTIIPATEMEQHDCTATRAAKAAAREAANEGAGNDQG